MTPETWIALGGFALAFLTALAGIVAYLLRQIDLVRVQTLAHVSEIYARRDSLSDLRGDMIRVETKLDVLLSRDG